MHKFTEEQIEYIKKVASGKYAAEITKLVNKKFNLKLKVSQIKTCKINQLIRSGIESRFTKGHIPANKGKKGMSPEQYEKCKPTMFKKGQAPQNHKPVGSERIDRDGYVLVKVAEPNKWKLKHRILWEQANGPIPEKHRLVFADGNRQNICLENLILVSYAESLIMSQRNLFKENASHTKVGANIAKLLNKAKTR